MNSIEKVRELAGRISHLLVTYGNTYEVEEIYSSDHLGHVYVRNKRTQKEIGYVEVDDQGCVSVNNLTHDREELTKLLENVGL